MCSELNTVEYPVFGSAKCLHQQQRFKITKIINNYFKKANERLLQCNVSQKWSV